MGQRRPRAAGQPVPRLSDGTAVFSVPQARRRDRDVPQDDWLPGHCRRHLPGLITTRYLFNFGPDFDSQGMISMPRPDFIGAPISSFISKTDKGGNDCGHPPADGRGADRRDHPLGAAPGRVGLNEGWRRRPVDSLRHDRGGAAGAAIPAVARGALRERSRLFPGGRAVGPSAGEGRPAPAEGTSEMRRGGDPETF